MAWIKAYKGFEKNMQCRGYQFEEGKEYSLPDGEEAKLCENGFHACEAPIDCLSYYKPVNSVYHEVELDATGYRSANVTTGDECKNEGHEGTINIGWGKDNKCKGKIGAYLVLCERGDWDGNKYPMIGEPKLVKVDDETVKADTWYMLKNGEIMEADDE